MESLQLLLAGLSRESVILSPFRRLAKMDLRSFMLYTFIGAGIWNIILAIIGYYVYEIRDRIFPYLGHILVVLGVAFVIYLIIKGRINRKKKNAEVKN